MKKPKPKQYVIAFDGTVRQYGPFKTGDAASKWAEKTLTNDNWAIRPLTTPF